MLIIKVHEHLISSYILLFCIVFSVQAVRRKLQLISIWISISPCWNLENSVCLKQRTRVLQVKLLMKTLLAILLADKDNYIPLINQVHSPYHKLWTKFFSSPYGASAKYAGHKKRDKTRIHNLRYGPSKQG